MEKVRVLLITQARIGSTRLPGKIFKEIQGKKLLEIHLDRLRETKEVDKILVATTLNASDDIVVEWANDRGVHVYRGSESDVLDRFYQAAKPIHPQWVVRVTSDCPLIDPVLVDEVIRLAKSSDSDYVANILVERFPDGQDIEVFKFSALERAWKEATLLSEREHVTPFIRNNVNNSGKMIFTGLNYEAPGDYSSVRMTVDEPADFQLIEQLVDNIGTKASWIQYVELIKSRKLQEINSGIIRNEGYLKSKENDKTIYNG